MIKPQNISHQVNGVFVEQRSTDGFINGTAMCVAHGKDVSDWLKTDDTWDLVVALADDLGIVPNDPKNRKSGNSVFTRVSAYYPSLAIVKRGSPDTGGGTWLHPDLALHLAQWCSKPFAIQVSRWIREWMTSGQNPIWTQQIDIDRVIYRDALKDEARLRMTGQVKVFLERIRKYDDKKYRGQFFSRVHDAINTAVTSETAKVMRYRISSMLGTEIKEHELIRDYFPAMYLQRYIAVCEAAANYMLRDGLHPITAVERATEIVLPANYLPEPIDFSENIKFVRKRLIQPTISQQLSQAENP